MLLTLNESKIIVFYLNINLLIQILSVGHYVEISIIILPVIYHYDIFIVYRYKVYFVDKYVL